MVKNRFIITLFLFFTFLQNIDAQCISGNCKEGKGIFVYPSGAKYNGTFHKGEIHGTGTCIYSDGSQYDGQWVSRYPEGKGMKTLKDGSKLVGVWKKGVLLDGQEIKRGGAVFVVKGKQDGDGATVQSGCINGDCEDGQGTYAFPDGSKYDGQFAQGKIHGYGTFYYANGDKYIGGFKVNVAHGKGVIYHGDGSQTVGQWKNGEYVGSGVIESGREGCIEGNCSNGKGTYIYKNGAAKYVGDFKNSLPHGQGTVFYPNGERFIGDWERGSFNGKGSLYLTDGSIVAGFWKDGSYINKEETVVENTSEDVDNQTVVKKDNIEKLNVWAVVVGVSSYTHMPVLRYTDDDAYRMYAFLKSPEGGALADDHIKILIDEEATREAILDNMKILFNQAKSNDLVLLYFSGHGLKGSFLPIDYDGYDNKLNHDEINAVLQKCQAKYKLCIADACHSGSLLAMKGASAENTLKTYYESLANAKSGTALIMSSKSEESSLEASGLRQGVFSHFLIRGLKGEADENNDMVVSVKELFDFVEKQVSSYTGRRQTPVLKGDYDPQMTVSVRRK